MTEIAYRAAIASDAAALAEFARRVWLDTFGHLPYPPDDLHAYLTEKYGEAIQRTEIADPAVRSGFQKAILSHRTGRSMLMNTGIHVFPPSSVRRICVRFIGP